MTAAADRLIDQRTGLIREVRRQPRRDGAPLAFVAYAACVAEIHKATSGIADPFAFGASLADEERAWWAAVGEAVERYCGNAVPGDLLRTSYAELCDRGVVAVDPESLALYSARQYGSPGFPFRAFDHELPVRWTPTVDVATGAVGLAPASLVYLNAYRSTDPDEARTNFTCYAGIAAGPTMRDAQRSAVEELIERDAVTIWWLSGGAATGIALDSLPELTSMLADPGSEHLSWTFLGIPSQFGVPVVGVLVEDPRNGIVAFGSACRATPAAAALKAATEAIQCYILALDLVDADSPLWRSVASGVMASHPYTPHRPDRTYREAFRPDYRDITDLAAQVQLWLDPRIHDAHLDRLRRPQRSVPADQLAAITHDDVLDRYVDRFSDAGVTLLCADLTTPDVRSAGLHVVRVLAPGLYGNAPAAFPYLGGERLYSQPALLGLVPGPLAEDDLIRRPVPSA